MKTFKYCLLPVLILMTSCYIYKPYTAKENEVIKNNSLNSTEQAAVSMRPGFEKEKEKPNPKEMSEEQLEQMKREEKEMEKANAEAKAGIPEIESKKDPNSNVSLNKNSPTAPGKKGGGIHSEDKKPDVVIEPGIKGKLQPNRYYKIEARGKQHKIQVDQWEGDTLVSHIIRRPEKELKFHKDEINEETILERRFSRPFSDLLTVGAYASVGAAVLLIVL
jgi:hypothetical protein